jgi:hypothetical protein
MSSPVDRERFSISTHTVWRRIFLSRLAPAVSSKAFGNGVGHDNSSFVVYYPKSGSCLFASIFTGYVVCNHLFKVGAGTVGGWGAARTGSIWPSLFSVIICNLVVVTSLIY